MNYTVKSVFSIIIILVCITSSHVNAQKVGLVLSGGGASGMAHIGVLKALEESNIPIDYIAGSSQGALIGAMYASGYSPKQIEAIVNSTAFKDLSEGIINHKYTYYFKREEYDASWISFKLSLDSIVTPILPTNVLSPIPMDFGLMEMIGVPAASKGSFDSLLVPFRCVASDIDKKESVVFKEGDLGEAIRASISYPFYIPPIRVDGMLLFDGGLYNNFPSDIMLNDFYPDIIIGSNVGSNISPHEDNLFSQVKCMFQNKSNYDVLCEGGIIIEPETEVGIFDFSDPQPVIDSGYVAAMRKMESIQQSVQRRVSSEELAEKRKDFLSTIPPVIYDSIKIKGLSKSQSSYALKVLAHKKKQVSLEEIKEGYFRLATDKKIKYISPKTVYNKNSGLYHLNLNIKKEKDIITSFGGNFSNRPISQGYISFQYNYLGKVASSITANAYFGKLYSSVQLKNRIDFPFKTPLYIEPNFTWNNWDYYKSSNAFLEDVKPAYLKRGEQYGAIHLGIPTGKKGRVVTGGGLASITDRYYQTSSFSVQDTADRTNFQVVTAQTYFEANSLNKKQYASEGGYFKFKVRYINGEENNTPGSTSVDTIEKYYKYHEWVTFKINGERYFNRRGIFKIGLLGEGMYSTQTLFNNYTASVLAAPAFTPTADSKTIFLENYRAHKYLAGGIKLIINIYKSIEFRTEAYLFQPVQTLNKTVGLKTSYGGYFALQHYIGTAGLVWHTPVGPMNLSVNFYDQEKNPFSILFHFGYVIFNQKALEQ